MKKKVFNSLGLMTGTSMDGVDLSLIKSDGYNQFTCVLDKYIEFDGELRESLINIREKLDNIDDLERFSDEINEIEKNITLFHAEIIEEIFNDNEFEIDLIGFHGQTVFHKPEKKISKQLGDAKLLSQLTKKIVVNNFRQQDLFNGGQGAPLTPIFHNLISNEIDRTFKIGFPVNVINIGGITNITEIINKENINYTGLYAYDIGPGNCLIDEWVRRNSKKKFDRNGNIAKVGKVNDLILNQAIENLRIDNYHNSLDIKDFDLSFIKGLSFEDGCATLTKFTAYTIAKGINFLNRNLSLSKKNYLVCGGGRKNEFLLDSIHEFLFDKEIKLEKIDKYGFDGDFIESQTFGYLAIRSFLNLPISFPNTTRCKKPTIGGLIEKNF